ncbi:MAG: hypothetical protein ABIR37_03555 [Candidatus Saccharimonadales bacterium]
MKSRITLCFLVLLCVFIVLPRNQAAHAEAFNQNRIIDDGIFDRTDSMNASQIDSFLNSFPNSCISPNSGFKAIDPTGYSPGVYQYGGFVTAGQVIYDAGQAYGLNPQVLLTTLQKEQSLVVGGAGYCNNGDQHKYAAAVGYGCPDSPTTFSYSGLNLYQRNGVTVTDTGTTCVNSAAKAGFSQQVIRAAWLFKFGEQRSKGNVGWAVIKGNWNNSDDPQTCYGGPMTQGTYQRCPSGATTYYDGYTTIDGTAVHMDTGGTAALYWYTPHFPGNQHFFDIFTGWFGSTQFPQPLGATLYHQASTGIIYLVTDSTRYQIPDWDMMINYGLDSYPVQTVSDTTIQSLANGGLLTNLIYDSNGVYLVNNGSRHPVSQTMCTSWGFSCSDGTKVKPLGAIFQTQYLKQGGLLTELLKVNGAVYKLSNGLRQPIANAKTLSDLNLATTPAITGSAVNTKQSLGALLMTTAGVVQFSPDPHIYYYDGTNYATVGDMDVYFDWGLNAQPYLSVPVSSFNQTPPTTSLLNDFVLSSGQYYVVDQGRRLSIPANLNTVWPSGQFSGPPQTLFNGLASGTLLPLVKAGGTVFLLKSGQKHYVQTIEEYSVLQSTVGGVSALRSTKLNGVAQGNDALADGSLINVQDGSGIIYVVNNDHLTHVPSPNVFDAYGYSWGAVRSYPTAITNDYPIDGQILTNSRSVDGTHYFVSGSTLYRLSGTQASDYGTIDSKFTLISRLSVKRDPATLSRFMLNTDDGRVYYASGGAIHYVSSYASYMAYGGGQAQRISVNTNTIQSFVIAQPI